MPAANLHSYELRSDLIQGKIISILCVTLLSKRLLV